MNKKRGLPVGFNLSNFDLTSAYVEVNKKISDKIKQFGENFINEIEENAVELNTNKKISASQSKKTIKEEVSLTLTEDENLSPKKQKKNLKESKNDTFEIEYSNKKQCVEKEKESSNKAVESKILIKNKWTEANHSATKSEFVSNDGINLRLNGEEAKNFKQNLTNPNETTKVETKVETKIEKDIEMEEEEDSDSEMYIPDIF